MEHELAGAEQADNQPAGSSAAATVGPAGLRLLSLKQLALAPWEWLGVVPVARQPLEVSTEQAEGAYPRTPHYCTACNRQDSVERNSPDPATDGCI